MEIRRRLSDFFVTKGGLNNFFNNLKEGYIIGDYVTQAILREYWATTSVNCYYTNTHKFTQDILDYPRDYGHGHFKERVVVVYPSTDIVTYSILKYDNTDDFINMYELFDVWGNKYWYDGEDHIEVKSFNQILSKQVIYKDKFSNRDFDRKKYKKKFNFIKNQ